jgi:hypothetical protein
MKQKVDKIKKNIFLYVNFHVLIAALLSSAAYLWVKPLIFPMAHGEELPGNYENYDEQLDYSQPNSNLEGIYLPKTKTAYCEEDKIEKRDTALCGQSTELSDQERAAYEKMTQPAKINQQIQPINQGPATTGKIAVRRPAVQKISCGVANDHPRKSDNKGKHQDEDCCPDPDEWPRPGCAYSAAGLALMLRGPK